MDTYRLPGEVLDLLSRQHGAVSRRQLVRDLHMSRRLVDGWVRRGYLEKKYEGTYRLPGSPRTREQELTLLVLRAGPHALAGPHASCALHGLEGFTLGRRLDVVVMSPYGVTGELGAPTVLLEGSDVSKVRNIPALAVPRALMNAIPDLTAKQQRVAIDDCHFRGLATKSALSDYARAHPWFLGARELSTLLQSTAMAMESEGERGLHKLMAGIEPAPELQVADLVPGRRLDFAWRRLRYALEYQGRDAHGHPEQQAKDGFRTMEVFEAGVEVQLVTARMVSDHGGRFRTAVERALARREREVAALEGSRR